MSTNGEKLTLYQMVGQIQGEMSGIKSHLVGIDSKMDNLVNQRCVPTRQKLDDLEVEISAIKGKATGIAMGVSSLVGIFVIIAGFIIDWLKK